MQTFHDNFSRQMNHWGWQSSSMRSAPPIVLLVALLFGVATVHSQKAFTDDQIATIKGQAEKGSAEEQWMLGHLFYYGDRGLEKNLPNAAEWYRKAAVQGHSRAQFYLGRMYERGEAVPQSSDEAFRWHSKAAESGDADAQYALAHLYLKGKGVSTNEVQALKWFKRAAFQNHSAAQGWCGYFYVNGVGVPQDYVEAYAWHNLSAASDPSNESLRGFRNQITDLMTKDQIANGQKRTIEIQKEIQSAQAQKKSRADERRLELESKSN